MKGGILGLNLVQRLLEFLKAHPGNRYTAREIAEWIFVTYPSECQAKLTRSQFLETDAQLVQQIVAEISGQRPRMQSRYPEIKTTEGRPRHYYYSEDSDEAELEQAERAEAAPAPEDGGEQKPPLAEHDLYPLLATYLLNGFGVYAMRIDEKRASNRRGPKGNQWLFPDLAGMEPLDAAWHPEVRACVGQRADTRTRLWSIEVKLLINRANVREALFQTVSNSTWANYGYLVAAEVGGADTLDELRLLATAYGVGFIMFNARDPAESEIVVPARLRPEVDWNLANRLAKENPDFLAYLKRVRHYYQIGETRTSDWGVPVDGAD